MYQAYAHTSTNALMIFLTVLKRAIEIWNPTCVGDFKSRWPRQLLKQRRSRVIQMPQSKMNNMSTIIETPVKSQKRNDSKVTDLGETKGAKSTARAKAPSQDTPPQPQIHNEHLESQSSELSTRIQDHLFLVDSELAGVAEASDLIRNYTRAKLIEVSQILESSDDQEDSLFEQIDESLMLIQANANSESEHAGYVWAQKTEDIGFLTALLDTWIAEDGNGEAEYLLESRWPGFSIKWDSFINGACSAHNEATDHLLEQDQLLERLDDYMGSAQEPETEATAVTA